MTKIRAIIFDVYKTILEVEPAPADAEFQWQRLWMEFFRKPASLNLGAFASASERAIAEDHVQARALGIMHPEIYWPEVTVKVLPELASLERQRQDDFLFEHAQLRHSVALMHGAGEVLRLLKGQELLAGIASNAQPYTLRELDRALSSTGLSRSLFKPELTFWSFQAGFSKPSPYLFRSVRARLAEFGIAPGETLMVGDRMDNDIDPARAQGWQVWQFRQSGECNETQGGDWEALRQFLNFN